MKINILGLDYEVIQVDLINNNQYQMGEIDYMNQVIRIKKDIKIGQKEHTLLHEITHGILDQLGLDELNDDEKFVQQLATGYYQTLKSLGILNLFSVIPTNEKESNEA